MDSLSHIASGNSNESTLSQWFASHWVYTIGPYDTLEETMAHLWLRINKKG